MPTSSRSGALAEDRPPGECSVGGVDMNAKFWGVVLWAVMALASVALVMLFLHSRKLPPTEDITFSELLAQIEEGRVHDVTIDGHKIEGHFLADNRSFSAYTPNDLTLVEKACQQERRDYRQTDLWRQSLADARAYFLRTAGWCAFVCVDISVAPDSGRRRDVLEIEGEAFDRVAGAGDV